MKNMKKKYYFLLFVLLTIMFSCKKETGGSFSENSPKRLMNEELAIQDLSREVVKVPEESVKEYFKARIIEEDVVLKVEPYNFAESRQFVSKGDVVEILSRNKERDKRGRYLQFWFKVKTSGGITGWIHGSDLDFFNTEPDYSAKNDLRLVHEVTGESTYSPRVTGHEFLGTVNYFAIDDNAEIKEVYLFDKYILILFKEGQNFSVFDYAENLEFEDYPVFGNVVAETNAILGPIGIWNDFLIVSSELNNGKKSFEPKVNLLEVYNLKNNRLSYRGRYFDDFDANWPGESSTIKVYQELDMYLEGNGSAYNEYYFDLTAETLESTGETKIVEFFIDERSEIATVLARA
jgi:hypothetical protein